MSDSLPQAKDLESINHRETLNAIVWSSLVSPGREDR
jgi:hypothetical protein